MIKCGENDGTGVFPMHEKHEDQMYVILFYSNNHEVCNAFGGIFDTYKMALDYLFGCGYTNIHDDDEDQILVMHGDTDWPSYARIKKFSVNHGVLAGGYINGDFVYFVPRSWQ